MEKELDIKLINGVFSSADGLLVIRELLIKKITFHETNLFSSDVRGVQDTLKSEERLIALKEELKKIDAFFLDLSSTDFISIESNIKVKVQESAQ
jgi:hypothetical protein